MAVTLISPTGASVKLDDLLAYDAETGCLTWKPRPRHLFHKTGAWKCWNSRYAGRPALNSPDKGGYRIGAIFDKMTKAHRAAWAIYYGNWPTSMLDHIDGDGANNKIANLREVTNSVNLQNATCRLDNKSGMMGVSWSKVTAKWFAYINHKGKRIPLGHYVNLDEAKAVRLAAEREYGFHKNHNRQRHAAVAACKASA